MVVRLVVTTFAFIKPFKDNVLELDKGQVKELMELYG